MSRDSRSRNISLRRSVRDPTKCSAMNVFRATRIVIVLNPSHAERRRHEAESGVSANPRQSSPLWS